MDLLGAIDAARQVRDAVRQARGCTEPWANDPEAFYRHFGVPHEAYAEVVSHMTEGQLDLLHRTIDVNPEAAVLWVLAMEEVEG